MGKYINTNSKGEFIGPLNKAQALIDDGATVTDPSFKENLVCVGIIFMIAGVILAKVVIIFDSTVIHYAGDIVGYGMHGIGLTPIIEGMSRSGKL